MLLENITRNMATGKGIWSRGEDTVRFLLSAPACGFLITWTLQGSGSGSGNWVPAATQRRTCIECPASTSAGVGIRRVKQQMGTVLISLCFFLPLKLKKKKLMTNHKHLWYGAQDQIRFYIHKHFYADKNGENLMNKDAMTTR